MLRLETIESKTLSLLERIQCLPELEDTRLVGGTALAMQLGHRISVDLDVFGRWDYSLNLCDVLAQAGDVEKESGTPDGRMGFFYVDGVKVDCVSYEMYKWLEPPVEEDGVRLAGIKDIAAMKVNAITNRSRRRVWEASRESLRNFIGKTQRRTTAPNAVSPPLVYLSGLSQAPHVMHRRRFPFSAPPMSETGNRCVSSAAGARAPNEAAKGK